MAPIISIPSNFAASTTEVMAQVFTDLQTPIILIVGVILALIAIDIFVGAMRK